MISCQNLSTVGHCLTGSYNRIMQRFTQLLCSNLFFQSTNISGSCCPNSVRPYWSTFLFNPVNWLIFGFTSEPLSQYKKISKLLQLVTWRWSGDFELAYVHVFVFPIWQLTKWHTDEIGAHLRLILNLVIFPSKTWPFSQKIHFCAPSVGAAPEPLRVLRRAQRDPPLPWESKHTAREHWERRLPSCRLVEYAALSWPDLPGQRI